MTTFLVDVFGPRQGHFDAYTIGLNRDQLTIEHTPHRVVCKWIEGRDPVWEPKPDSLFDALSNESTQAPEILTKALVWVWTRWRYEELSDEEAEVEIKELFAWVNKITEIRPKTKFWTKFMQ